MTTHRLDRGDRSRSGRRSARRHTAAARRRDLGFTAVSRPGGSLITAMAPELVSSPTLVKGFGEFVKSEFRVRCTRSSVSPRWSYRLRPCAPGSGAMASSRPHAQGYRLYRPADIAVLRRMQALVVSGWSPRRLSGGVAGQARSGTAR